MPTKDPGTRIVRPLRGGRVTIPAEFRRRLGIESGALVEISVLGGELRVRPLTANDADRASNWLAELYEHFAPVRKEAEQLNEEEIDAAIDHAVHAVRRA